MAIWLSFSVPAVAFASNERLTGALLGHVIPNERSEEGSPARVRPAIVTRAEDPSLRSGMTGLDSRVISRTAAPAPFPAQDAASGVPVEKAERSLTERYREALSAYTSGDFARAAPLFQAIVTGDEKDPLTLKSRYFLARSCMHLKRWTEASSDLIAIYAISPSFFSEWSCDYLLGECRQAMGRD
ncbi:MAG: tetratricopeptide repeat protein [Acidobacteriota bacterium]